MWHALSDNDARDQWFGGGAEFDVREKSHDFRVGGHGIEDGQWHGGPTSRFVSTYTDIVDQQRMVFTYDMWVDDRHMSTSLTTIAVEPDGEATRLTYTEQGVHFDGLDTVEGREEGTRGLLDTPRLVPDPSALTMTDTTTGRPAAARLAAGPAAGRLAVIAAGPGCSALTNLVIYAIGRCARRGFTTPQNGDPLRVDPVAITIMSLGPLATGLALIAAVSQVAGGHPRRPDRRPRARRGHHRR